MSESEFPNPEAAGDVKQPVESQPPNTEMAVRASKYNAAGDKPYSVFTRREKVFIVTIASFAALFSPLTADIYFPVTQVISNEFHKSVELINLTVTIYMISQGISPMFWGPLSDRLGRRPIMFTCLATLALSCVGLALVPTSTYWLLMLLRCLQAAGSTSTVVVGAGIIADIATPAERGGFVGKFILGPLTGLSLGPVIGGALAQAFDWRAIFWFLCISSALCFFGLILFLPETLRVIVGDGSIPAGWIYTPSIPVIGRQRKMMESNERPPRKPFQNPLKMLAYPDVIILLLINGTYYAVMYGVIASLSMIFEKIYSDLSQTDIGLCFVPLGGGMAIGSAVSGKCLDAYYGEIRDNLISQSQTTLENNIDSKTLEEGSSFPIEKARLQVLPYIMFIYTACVIGYGWSLQSRVTIAIPLILQFIIGLTIVTIMNAIQTLLVDLFPDQGSSVTACNYVVRCSMGAGMVSVIHPILSALGDGWAYTFFGGLCVLVSPLLYVEIRWGPIWRKQRQEQSNS